jgi:GST-like protein
MDGDYVVHGAKGSGSVAVEAALTLMGLPYSVVESSLFKGDDPELNRLNPMRQVPALILPSGEMMTESAAILTWLADAHPEARLAPALADGARPAFLRWMAFVASAIYALYWVRDEPGRVVTEEAARTEVNERLKARISECWGMMDAQVQPGRYILGEEMSVLDVYVTVVSRWIPGRRRFYEAAPKLAPVVRRVDADPRLAALWAERFPAPADG